METVTFSINGQTIVPGSQSEQLITVDSVAQFEIAGDSQHVLTFLMPFDGTRPKAHINYGGKELTKKGLQTGVNDLADIIISILSSTEAEGYSYILINTAGIDWMGISKLIDYVEGYKKKDINLFLLVPRKALQIYNQTVSLEIIRLD